MVKTEGAGRQLHRGTVLAGRQARQRQTRLRVQLKQRGAIAESQRSAGFRCIKPRLGVQLAGEEAHQTPRIG